MEKYVEFLLSENLENVKTLPELSKQPIPIDGKTLSSAYAETIGHVERIHKIVNDGKEMDLREKELENELFEKKQKAEREANEQKLKLRELDIRQLEIETKAKSEAEERRLKEMELQLKHEEHEADNKVDMFTSIGTIIGSTAGAAFIGYIDSIKVISTNALRYLSKPFTIFKQRR